MEAADDTRKHWASLLAGKGPLNALALGTWLGLAAAALGADTSTAGTADVHAAAPAAPRDPATEPPASSASSAETVNWAAALSPLFGAWTEALDTVQGSAWTWFTPLAESPLGRLLSHPAAVIGGEQSPGRLSLHAGLALVDFVQAAAAHQALQALGWAKAFQRFVADFGNADGGATAPVALASLDDLMTHWSVVGEAALQAHSRSEPFLRSQADMLRRAMGYRIAHRHMIEAASRANDLPTLTDLDEAFAAIHALRRELRGLRQLAEGTALEVSAANARRARSAA
jgi:hypothetical protein